MNKSNIINDYLNKVSVEIILKTYSISTCTLYKYLKEENVGHRGCRKYNVKENYFDTIDTCSKAYILGFIYADGCVSKNRLTVTLHDNDISILHFIKTEMQSEIELYHSVKKSQISFSIYSKHITNSLKSLNILERKTYSTIFPILPDKYIADFICGYFDGDGSVYISKKKQCRLSFTCYNFIILSILQRLLLENFSISSKIVSKSNSGYDLLITSFENILKFYEQIYKKSPFKLLRKQDKLFDWLYNHKHSFKSKTGVCSTPDCGKPHRSRGYCIDCYYSHYRKHLL